MLHREISKIFDFGWKFSGIQQRRKFVILRSESELVKSIFPNLAWSVTIAGWCRSNKRTHELPLAEFFEGSHWIDFGIFRNCFCKWDLSFPFLTIVAKNSSFERWAWSNSMAKKFSENWNDALWRSNSS